MHFPRVLSTLRAVASVPTQEDLRMLFSDKWHCIFLRRTGGSISVFIPENGSNQILLEFKRRIEREDVKDGKLIPTTETIVKRRGGKKCTTIALSHESAEDLYRILKPALREARRRRHTRRFMRTFSVIVELYTQNSSR